MENITVNNIGESNFIPDSFNFAPSSNVASPWYNATGTPTTPTTPACTCNCCIWSCILCDGTKLGVVALPLLLKGSTPSAPHAPSAPPKPPANPYTPWIWGLGLTGVAALGIGVFLHYKSIKAGKAGA